MNEYIYIYININISYRYIIHVNCYTDTHTHTHTNKHTQTHTPDTYVRGVYRLSYVIVLCKLLRLWVWHVTRIPNICELHFVFLFSEFSNRLDRAKQRVHGKETKRMRASV